MNVELNIAEDVAAVVPVLEQIFVAAVGVTTVALGRDRASEDLTLPQWRALVILADAQPQRVGVIAGRLGMSLPSASRLNSRMERRGLVTTARDEADRRATIVSMTTEGAAVQASVVVTRKRLLEDALGADGTTLRPGTTEALQAVVRALGAYR